MILEYLISSLPNVCGYSLIKNEKFKDTNLVKYTFKYENFLVVVSNLNSEVNVSIEIIDYIDELHKSVLFVFILKDINQIHFLESYLINLKTIYNPIYKFKNKYKNEN